MGCGRHNDEKLTTGIDAFEDKTQEKFGQEERIDRVAEQRPVAHPMEKVALHKSTRSGDVQENRNPATGPCGRRSQD